MESHGFRSMCIDSHGPSEPVCYAYMMAYLRTRQHAEAIEFSAIQIGSKRFQRRSTSVLVLVGIESSPRDMPEDSGRSTASTHCCAGVDASPMTSGMITWRGEGGAGSMPSPCRRAILGMRHTPHPHLPGFPTCLAHGCSPRGRMPCRWQACWALGLVGTSIVATSKC